MYFTVAYKYKTGYGILTTELIQFQYVKEEWRCEWEKHHTEEELDIFLEGVQPGDSFLLSENATLICIGGN